MEIPSYVTRTKTTYQLDDTLAHATGGIIMNEKQRVHDMKVE